MSAAYNWRGKVSERTQRRNSIGSNGESWHEVASVNMYSVRTCML